MVHWCYTTYTFYKDGKTIYLSGYTSLTDREPKHKVIEITWDNISEVFQKYEAYFPGILLSAKKGRVFSFWNDNCIGPFGKNYQKDLKEWKDDLHLVLEISYGIHDDVKSINDVLNYRDSNMAIKYLAERGLGVINGK